MANYKVTVEVTMVEMGPATTVEMGEEELVLNIEALTWVDVSSAEILALVQLNGSHELENSVGIITITEIQEATTQDIAP